MGFRFIHAADVHLDSPLLGLSARTDAPIERVRGTTRQAFENLVALALKSRVDLVVIAGDLYDGTWRDMRTGIFAMQQLARLGRAGIKTFIVLGNHDAESRITADLPRPEGVHIFGTAPGEVVPLDDLGVAVHGRSFAKTAETDNLAREYAAPLPDFFNIAVLHTALDGGHAHANYAPCSLDELRSSGHDYWALGHVHDHVVHSEYPHVVYPGNLQARSVREIGRKGAVLVEVEGKQVCSLQHVALDELRWAHLPLQVAPDARDLHSKAAAAFEDVCASSEGRPVLARVSVEASGAGEGSTALDNQVIEADLRALAAQAAGEIWLEKIIICRELRSGVSLPEELLEVLAGALTDGEAFNALEAALKPLSDRLPAEWSEAGDLLRLVQQGDWHALASSACEAISTRVGGHL